MSIRFNPFTGTIDFDGTSTLDTNSFATIQTDFGTYPAAITQTDILTLTSSDGSVVITGNSATDTIDFSIDDDFVKGPASSTSNALARFNGTTGKLIKNSSSTLSDTDDLILGGTFTPSKAVYESVVALTDAASIATDASLGNIFTVTIAGNRTLANPTNPISGQKCIWRIKQDGTGNRTITLDTAFRLGYDVTSVILSTAANKTDYIAAIYNSSDSKWDVVAVATGY